MLSTISPIFLAESLLGSGHGNTNNLLPSHNGGFTPWENFESFFASYDQKPTLDHDYEPQSKPDLRRYHADLVSGLDHPNQIFPCFDHTNSPDSASPNQNSVHSSSGSDDPNQNSGGSNVNSCNILDERKRKRMVSNRESARRSRMRKQRHLENIRSEANRLKLENREGTNRLQLLTHHIQLVTRENDRLKAESVILQRRLLELSQIWQLQQLHYSNNNHDYRPPAPPCMPMQIMRHNEQTIIP